MLIDKGLRVDIPLLEYSKRRAVVMKECYVVLGESFVHYKVDCVYEKLDEDTGIWKDTKSNWRYTRRRCDIVDVSMYYDNEEHVWSVGLEYSGVSGAQEWMFSDPREALRIYNTLADYMTRTAAESTD